MRTASKRRFFAIAATPLLLLLLVAGVSLPTACVSAARSPSPSPDPEAPTTHAAQTTTGASVPLPPEAVGSQAGFYRTRVGDIDVTVLSDGTVGLDVVHGLALDAAPGEVERLLAQSFQKSPIDASFNSFLLRVSGKTILIDTGCAASMGPTAGKLPQSLAHAGVRGEDVTDVFLTHIHPDHSGGLVVDGKKAFPNATIHVDQKDLDYWLNTTLAAQATGMQASFFASARATLEPYVAAGRVKAFAGAASFFPGFRAKPAYGHTPGHAMYVLESKDQKLVFWGDLIHIPAAQFDDPGIAVGFDSNPAMAVETRKSALADAADHGYLVAHDHASFPGLGHIRRDGRAYRWVPLSYVNDSPNK